MADTTTKGPEAGVDFQKVDDPAATVEASPGKGPEDGGSDLLKAAQAKAPNLTKDFVKEHKITDDELAQIARGELSPPPTVGPVKNTQLTRTPGGWVFVSTPIDVAPEDFGNHKIGALR
jgi:hypothetical protein